MAERVKFWMVWNPDNRPPMKKHLDKKSAESEAERLIADGMIREVYILEAISGLEVRTETIPFSVVDRHSGSEGKKDRDPNELADDEAPPF